MPAPLEEALADLRVSGSVLLHETYAAPWAIEMPGQAVLRALMGVSQDTRVIPFHLLKSGRFELVTRGGPPVIAERDDLVVCSGGLPHQMRAGATASAVPMEDILSGAAAGSKWDGKGDATELICGVFMLRSTPLNPLLDALPSVLVCPTAGANANPMLMHAARMLAVEVASPNRELGGYTRARLLEIFCAEAIRSYQKGLEVGAVGWLRGLNDPKIAAAIAQVHANPAEPWTVDRLAGVAALSPSRFAARFRDTVGTTAMDYVTRWRMSLACRLLTASDASVEAVADKVGYGGAAAFSRAFRDHIGVSPAKWRASRASRDMD